MFQSNQIARLRKLCSIWSSLFVMKLWTAEGVDGMSSTSMNNKQAWNGFWSFLIKKLKLEIKSFCENQFILDWLGKACRQLIVHARISSKQSRSSFGESCWWLLRYLRYSKLRESFEDVSFLILEICYQVQKFIVKQESKTALLNLHKKFISRRLKDWEILTKR